MNSWVREPAIECFDFDEISECIISAGFGDAQLIRDEGTLFSAIGKEWEDCMTFEEAEAMAAADPDHDWRIWIYMPLSEEMYQRHGPRNWAIIAKGIGFA